MLDKVSKEICNSLLSEVCGVYWLDVVLDLLVILFE